MDGHMKIKSAILITVIFLINTHAYANRWCNNTTLNELKTEENIGKAYIIDSNKTWTELTDTNSMLGLPHIVHICLCVPESSNSNFDTLFVHVLRNRTDVVLYNNYLHKNIIIDNIEILLHDASRQDLEFKFSSDKTIPFRNNNVTVIDPHFKAYHGEAITGYPDNIHKKSFELWHYQQIEKSYFLVSRILNNHSTTTVSGEFLFRIKPGRDAPSWIPLKLELLNNEQVKITSIYSSSDPTPCTYQFTKRN